MYQCKGWVGIAYIHSSVNIQDVVQISNSLLARAKDMTPKVGGGSNQWEFCNAPIGMAHAVEQ